MTPYGTSERGEVGKGSEQPRNVTTSSLGSKPSSTSSSKPSSKTYGTSERGEVGKGSEPEIKYNGSAQADEVKTQVNNMLASIGEREDAVKARYNRSYVAKEFVNLEPPSRPIKRTKSMEKNIEISSYQKLSDTDKKAISASGMETGDYLGEQQNLSFPKLSLGASLAPTSTIKNYDTFSEEDKNKITKARRDFDLFNVLTSFRTTDPTEVSMSMFTKREAGNYDTLFGNAELKRNSGFYGKKVTGMTLGELEKFTKTDKKWLNYNIKEHGLRTTAVGKFQFVGTTLFGNSKQEGIIKKYGWPIDTVFTPAVQNLMMLQLAAETMYDRTLQQKYGRDSAKDQFGDFKNFKKTKDFKKLSTAQKKAELQSVLKTAYDPLTLEYKKNSTGKVVEPRTIVGGVTQKGYARASDLKARALRAKWEGFSQKRKVPGKDVFGNDKYEYVISNEEINKLGYEMQDSINKFVEERKKQGLKEDFFNMKIKPVRM
jgi:hypothetical protein